MQTTA